MRKMSGSQSAIEYRASDDSSDLLYSHMFYIANGIYSSLATLKSALSMTIINDAMYITKGYENKKLVYG